MAAGTSTAANSERDWFITQRWQAYEAESRANLLRIIAVGAFYIVHLWTYFSSQGRVPNFGFFQIAEAGEITRQFHIQITLLAVAWAMLALGVLVALQQRIFPLWMPYCTTGCDIVLLTMMLCISSGARSPLVVGYFLILVLAALRLSLPLVWFSTTACAMAYLVVLGCVKWVRVADGAALADRLPRYHQIIVLVAIVIAGMMLGQVVRAAWRLVGGANGPKTETNR